MLHRHSLLVVALSLAFILGYGGAVNPRATGITGTPGTPGIPVYLGSLGISPAYGDTSPADQATATQLFEQGQQLYAKGDVDGALKIFKRIDPVQLDKDQRVQLYQYLTGDPTRLMQDAADAQAAGQLSRAAKLYQLVTTNNKATDGQKETAAARLAEINRQLQAGLARARPGSIDEATLPPSRPTTSMRPTPSCGPSRPAARIWVGSTTSAWIAPWPRLPTAVTKPCR